MQEFVHQPYYYGFHIQVLKRQVLQGPSMQGLGSCGGNPYAKEKAHLLLAHRADSDLNGSREYPNIDP